MQAPDVEHRTLRSYDGTMVAYQVRGAGPAVVLANGLGGTYSTWRHQYNLFGDRYRIICWDYRGLFRSGRPARLETLALDQQVRDLELILEAEHVDRALFLGWSMGVQFNFEYYRRHADQFVGLVVLNGVAGTPFRTIFGSEVVGHLMPSAIAAMKVAAPVIGYAMRAVTSWSGLVPLIQQLGFAARSLDVDVFTDLATEYAGLDFEAYGEMLHHLGGHDATDLLHRISVPTLIITGSRDLFTPLPTAEAMASAIPSARLFVQPGGTHYVPVEFPREVNEQLRTFVRQLAYGSMS
jgi:pimeloyl-ACP methyl ester carboxylesterase